ncbi:MAG: DUF928 domain-containing protein [Nostoc sp.]|uniref:DUF928 domain-containing protein n=1 Tax=Nostoc sp. TaxID=1180 RepID=UPI002FF82E7D
MIKFNSQIFFFIPVSTTLVLTSNTTLASLLPQQNPTVSNQVLISVDFKPPKDPAPKTSVGGGTRGNVQFGLPGGSAPRTSVGGGTRGNVQFGLPGGSAPRTSVGGGTRGNVQFGLPGGSAPRTSVGGGTRGNVQFGLPGGSAPRTSVGGGTRGNVQLTLPSGNSTPRSSIGGGTRGKTLPLTALVPPTKQGRTVLARPTIFAYLPPVGAETVFFSLQDEDGNPHYSTMLKVSPDGGVVSITLPPTAPALAIDKNYLWYFAPIEPGGVLRPDNYSVTGWIKRVKSTFNQQELASSPVKLATKYAEAGVWYDTLKVLAEAKRSQPNNKDFATEWHDLLKQVGLEDIASQPLTEAF